MSLSQKEIFSFGLETIAVLMYLAFWIGSVGSPFNLLDIIAFEHLKRTCLFAASTASSLNSSDLDIDDDHGDVEDLHELTAPGSRHSVSDASSRVPREA